MFRTLEDFKNEWVYESESTLNMFRHLTNESLSTKVYDEGRTLGFLAWHITVTLSEMMQKTGLRFDGLAEDAPDPRSVEVYLQTYQGESNNMFSALSEQWTDAMLAEEIELYGQQFRRGAVLSMLIKHQIHHRAQMTVLMRQAGLNVPGVYGPSKEEWAQFGMPPME